MQPIYNIIMVTKDGHYWQRHGFFGGHVFLDFLNTFDNLDKHRTLDALPNWETVLLWSLESKVLNKNEFSYLTQSFSQPNHSELSRLHHFRDLAWKVLSDKAQAIKLDLSELAKFTREIKWAYSTADLLLDNDKFKWNIECTDMGSSVIQARLGLKAGELLSSSSLNKITECQGCSGLFLNTGRGVGRRWCRMSTCGNRAKISKFRAIH